MKRSDGREWRKDGNLSFSGGQDGSVSPSDIDRDQFALGENVTARGGHAHPRPGGLKRVLTFATKVTTTADFVIPALNSTVTVQVTDTSAMSTALADFTIGMFTFTLVTIDSGVQVTLKNNDSNQAGITVTHPATVFFYSYVNAQFQTGKYQHCEFYNADTPQILCSISGHLYSIDPVTYRVQEITPYFVQPTSAKAQTKTTGNFTVPAVGATVNVNVVSTAGMTMTLPNIKIGGCDFVITVITPNTQITVRNDTADNVGRLIGQPATVDFTVIVAPSAPVLDVNNGDNDIGWSTQAETYWIYQDNQSLPIIYDGTGCRRAIPAQSEVPVGNVITYCMGRVATALTDRKSYRVGDLVFGSSGTAKFNYVDALLKFTENNYLNEGGDFVARVFGAPSNSGIILAMKAGAMTDNSLGQGPLQVGTPDTVFTVQLPFDRTTWKNLANALQTANPIKGPLGQRSTVLINCDLWYRSNDPGIRSYFTAQRQFNGSWGNTPMSAELDDLLDFDDESLLEHGSAVLFDNRLLMTFSPVATKNGVYHRGLVALDFNLVSTIRKQSGPAWEGVWTLQRILHIITGKVNHEDHCWFFSLNTNNQIELWELEPTSRTDEGGTPISWALELPSYNCGDSDNFKRLETARIGLTSVTGLVSWKVRIKTDRAPCWVDWESGNVCARDEDCGPFACTGPQTFRSQQRQPIRLHSPPDTFDDTSGLNFRTGYEFQPRLEFTGWAEMPHFRIFATDEPESLGVVQNDTT